MATYPIKMLKDEENQPFVPLVSTDCIRDENNQTLQQILDKKLSPTNLLSGEYVSITTEGNNCYINVDLPASLNVINNLTTTSAGQGALDAYQGKVLKDSIPQVVNDLSSTSTTSALSANQGYVLNQKFNDYTLTSALEDLIKQYILASHPIGSIEINISGANPSTYLGGTWIAWGTGKVPVGINTSDTDFNTVEKTGGAKNHTHTYTHTHGVPGVAHTHTTGNHTLTVAEIPSHTHSQNSHYHAGLSYGSPDGGGNTCVVSTTYDSTGCIELGWSRSSTGYPYDNVYTKYSTATNNNTGGDGAHNHGNTGSTTPSATTTNSQSTSTSGSSSNLQPYITCYMWKRTA